MRFNPSLPEQHILRLYGCIDEQGIWAPASDWNIPASTHSYEESGEELAIGWKELSVTTSRRQSFTGTELPLSPSSAFSLSPVQVSASTSPLPGPSSTQAATDEAAPSPEATSIGASPKLNPEAKPYETLRQELAEEVRREFQGELADAISKAREDTVSELLEYICYGGTLKQVELDREAQSMVDDVKKVWAQV